MAPDEFINVEVAYATPEKQLILKVEVPAGTTAAEAVRLSGIEEHFPEVSAGSNPLGVFGKKVKASRELDEGDRQRRLLLKSCRRYADDREGEDLPVPGQHSHREVAAAAGGAHQARRIQHLGTAVADRLS